MREDDQLYGCFISIHCIVYFQAEFHRHIDLIKKEFAF